MVEKKIDRDLSSSEKSSGEITDRLAGISPAKRALLELRLRTKSSKAAPPKRIARREDPNRAPLSLAQQRIWFLDQFTPGNPANNVVVAYRLRGSLDRIVLEKSLNEIVRRHEVLRTTFNSSGYEPVALIIPELTLNLTSVNLKHLSDSERDITLQRHIADETWHPFDLNTGPLLRAKLFLIGNENHILLLTMHHIVNDAWSRKLIYRELSMLYEAFQNGEPCPLPELPIQYGDYAQWQRQWLQGESPEIHLRYWRKQLDGRLAVMELPLDHPRSAVQTYRGGQETLSLPQDLYQYLKALGKQEGATLFMTLLAAFQILLYRYSNQEDIIVGSPTANRTIVETEGMIGYFANIMLLRTDLSGMPTFRQYLGRVREVCLGAYAHQDLPFEKLLEELNPERDLSRTPLFQVMFNLENLDIQVLAIQGLSISEMEIESRVSPYDLTLETIVKGERLVCIFNYITDLFEAATIQRMAGHFQTILESITADPEQQISELPMLTSTERHQVLVEWNDTKTDYARDRCIHDLFEDQVERTPDATAVVYENQQITYRELNRRANKLAHFLQAQGVGPEVLVGICLERSMEMMVSLFGILKAGGAYVPLDPKYPEKRLAYILQDSKVTFSLTNNKVNKCLPESGTRIINLDIERDALALEREDNPISGAGVNNPAYLIYTSGSTGIPKGVIGLHRTAVNRFNWMWETYPFEKEEVCCHKTSLSFVDAVWEIFGPLLRGISTVLIPDEILKDPHLLIQSLAAESVTRIVLVPASLRVLLSTFVDLQHLLPKLNLWITSGEEISAKLVKQFYKTIPQSILLNLYGSTEVSADCTWYDTRKGKLSPHVPIGRPISNTRIYLLDSNLQPVPIGVPGEIHVGGDGLARGYLNRPELTKKRFIRIPYLSEPLLYRTGDLACYRPDGNLEFLGRIDNQVKIRGYRIELGEIEALLNQHPAVGENVVMVRDDAPDDRRLVAYLVANTDDLPPEPDLRRFLKERLPDYMVPSAFVFLNALPLTPSGKVDRKELPAPALSQSEPVETLVAPRDELELQLTRIWEMVLGVQPIGVSDNFFELGGHSLLAVYLFTQIEKILGKNLPIATLFEAPTVGQLAGFLREIGWTATWSSLEAIETTGAGSANASHKIARHIPAKIYPYLKKQYRKIKQHSGYFYLNRHYFRAKSSFTKRFLSYQTSQLKEKLREIGLAESDTVYMHSAFNAFNGFSGGPQQIIDCILNVVGDAGNLLMVSMPYTGTTDDHLKTVKTFDVIKTESSMGIITEIFRRKKDVLRSLNPAHPILAYGPDAKWIISDHDKTKYSCGKGSPFAKILELNAKALFFDVPFKTMTFFHYLEDRFKDCSPLQLYDDEPLENTVIDSKGKEIRVKTYVFSQEARDNRSARLIERELKMKKMMTTDTIGNTKLTLVNLKDVVGCAQALVNEGIHFYN